MKRNRQLSVDGVCGVAILSLIPAIACAVEQPTPFSFDAGPLGTLELSGGADGYAYALTGAGDEQNKGLLGTSTSVGLQFLNGLVKLEKPDGLFQFTIEAGAVNSLTLGTKPKAPTVQKWSTGPFRTAYVTVAPTPNFSISAGQLGSLEGYESAVDWKNFNMLTTSLWEVENAQSVGVSATYTYERLTGTVVFSDGFDTNVWNYLQLLASYSINDDNNLTLFGATNLGATGLGAGFYGNATRPYSSTTVASAGAANFVNSSVVGGYYSFTTGNLTLVPEVQYVWSRKDPEVGLTGYSSHFGAALFVNYQLGRFSVLYRRLARIFHQQWTGDLVSQSWRSRLWHGGGTNLEPSLGEKAPIRAGRSGGTPSDHGRRPRLGRLYQLRNWPEPGNLYR